MLNGNRRCLFMHHWGIGGAANERKNTTSYSVPSDAHTALSFVTYIGHLQVVKHSSSYLSETGSGLYFRDVVFVVQLLSLIAKCSYYKWLSI